MEWEKIFANYVSDKGSIPKYIKNLYNSIAKKYIFNFKKWSEHFSKEDIQMATGT